MGSVGQTAEVWDLFLGQDRDRARRLIDERVYWRDGVGGWFGLTGRKQRVRRLAFGARRFVCAPLDLRTARR